MRIYPVQWYTKYRSVLLKVIMAALLVDIMIDPSNLVFQVKYLFFGLLFLFWLPKLGLEKITLPKNLLWILIFISFFMPFYALALGLIHHYFNNTEMGSIVYLNSFFFFLLALIVVDEGFNLTKIFTYSSLLIVLITLTAYVILLLNPISFGKLYEYAVIDKQVAIYSLRKYGDYTVLQMFYKTSPLLVFPLSYFLHQLFIQRNFKGLFFKMAALILLAVTLFLSGTRANMLSLVLILMFYLAWYIFTKSKKFFVLLMGVYGIIGFIGIYTLSELLLNAQEISNQVKFGHFISYIEHFSEYIGDFIYGQGLGSRFYSSGIHQMTNITELSYFELIRIWGLPITIVFFLVLLLPLYYEIRARKISALFIAYLAYLFIAGTNPLLLSSTGMVVLVYVFSEMILRSRKIALDKNVY